MMSQATNPLFEIASGSDRGRVRRRNEDCVRVLPKHGLAVLSDGMGGHRAGDIASRIAVDVITRELTSTDVEQPDISRKELVCSLSLANKTIRDTASSKRECEGMGATALVAIFTPYKVIAAHLGDSRLYLYMGNKLTQLTEDHTLAQKYINEGLISIDDAKTWAGRNMLMRALGIQKHIDPEITEIRVESNQLFILCSDGLTDAVGDNEICATIKTALKEKRPLQSTVNELIDLANDNGGPDNISIVLARTSQQAED